MLRPSVALGACVLALPTILISEPADVIPQRSELPPLEMLYTGALPLEYSRSLFVRVQDQSPVRVNCDGTQKVLKQNTRGTIIKLSVEKNCSVPIAEYQGVRYVLPIAELIPDRYALSDVSTSTLQNTLKASSIIRSNYALGTENLQQFFQDIQDILSVRSQAFSYPISSPLPSQKNFLPNAPRPYRSSFTDGVHHGWDFYVPEGTPVTAIEDGQILMIKRNFSWDEMDHLLDARSELARQENLHVYRGNSVYIKTLSGHVDIYAHLRDIPEYLQIGDTIKRGDTLGFVGDSAVPAKQYLYHLHFELSMNPFDDDTAGTSTFKDALLWPFWGKGRSVEWILNHGPKLFE